MNDKVQKLPLSTDRDFFRVDGAVYLLAEPQELETGIKANLQGVDVPTFSQDEDDIVGLSIDAFREELALSDLDRTTKEHLIKLQQLISMTKRHFDAALSGKKHKLFKKQTVNISGSGMAFMYESPLVVGQKVKMSMYFPRFPFKYISVIANVIKSEKTDQNYIIKCNFENISERVQDDILRFVNQCQRDSRKR